MADRGKFIIIIIIIDKLTLSMADRGKFLGIGGMNLKKLTNETGITQLYSIGKELWLSKCCSFLPLFKNKVRFLLMVLSYLLFLI